MRRVIKFFATVVFFSIISIDAMSQPIPNSELEALDQIYDELVIDGPNWANWKRNGEWDFNNIENWKGLSLEIINGDYHVTEVDFTFWSINGSISNLTKINQLEFLVKLHLGKPYNQPGNLSGNIEDLPISGMQFLESINIRLQQIGGDIGAWDLSRLPSLNHINLERNENIGGNIDDWVCDLPNLRRLDLSDNKIGGRIEDWNLDDLTSLREIDLWDNEIEGIIGEFDVSNLIYLEDIILGGNLISGNIQDWNEVANLANLTFINLRSQGIGPDDLEHKIGGDISLWDISTLQSLEQLWLNFNKIEGSLYNWDLTSLSQLTQILLNNNNIDGLFYHSFSDSHLPPNLSEFDISNNKITFADLNQWTIKPDIETFSYAPQQRVDIEEVIELYTGETGTFAPRVDVGEPFLEYTWYHGDYEDRNEVPAEFYNMSIPQSITITINGIDDPWLKGYYYTIKEDNIIGNNWPDLELVSRYRRIDFRCNPYFAIEDIYPPTYLNTCQVELTPNINFDLNRCEAEEFIWEIDGGAPISIVPGPGEEHTALPVVYDFNEYKSYHVKLTVKYHCDDGCESRNEVYEEDVLINGPYTVDLASNVATCGVEFESSLELNDGVCAPTIEWDFGDGNTSSEPNPTHLYEMGGIYDVQFNVDLDCGDECDPISNVHRLLVNVPEEVTADFTQENYGACGYMFFPNVENPENCAITGYEWDFDTSDPDNGVSDLKYALHEFPATGTYPISLTVYYDCTGCWPKKFVIEKDVYIDIDTDPFEDMSVDVTTNVYEDILSASATTFSGAWMIDYDDPDLDERNGYLTGKSGVWKGDGAYVFRQDRSSSLDPTTPTSNPQLDADGTFTLETFNWQYANLNAIPDWLKVNEITKYNSNSFETENKDILGIYSSSIYGYKSSIPVAVGQNMKNLEMAFTSFEDLDDITNSYEKIGAGNWDLVNEGTRYDYQSFPIFFNAGNVIFLYNTPLSELDGINQVSIVSGRTGNVLTDVNILCKTFYGGLFNLTQIVVDKNFSNLFLLGDEVVYHVEETADHTITLSTDLAHTGSHSMKVESDITYEQGYLDLEPGKKYFISGWAADDESLNLFEPVIGCDPEVVLTFRDESGVIIEDLESEPENPLECFEDGVVEITPEGNVLEGWQKFDKSFCVPEDMASWEITFKNGTSACYYDDLRLHTFEGNMQSYVYENDTYRLRAVLDENNYASLYYYDEEGNLYLVKKETERGIKTIKEVVNYKKTLVE